MWPAVPQAAPAPVVSADAVWLQQWLQHHAQSKAPKGTWTRAALAARLSRFGALLAQAEHIEGKTEEEATTLAEEVDQIIESVGEERALQQFVSKELKRQRKERSIARKRARKEEKMEAQEAERALMDKLVNEWQEVNRKADKEKVQQKEARKERARAEAQQAEDKRRRDEHAKKLAKLELLLSVRAHRSTQPLHRDAQLREFYAQLLRVSNASNSSAAAPPPSQPPLAAGSSAPLAEYWESYLNGAHSVESLLEVRRCWDEHLTKENQQGSCIPPYWLTPVPPSSSWRRYLIYANQDPQSL